MDFRLRVLCIVISSLFLLHIARLIKRNRLKESYSLGWLGLGAVCFWLAAWPEPFFLLTGLLGVVEGLNALFLLGILFSLASHLQMSVKVTELERHLERLVREIAMSSTDSKIVSTLASKAPSIQSYVAARLPTESDNSAHDPAAPPATVPIRPKLLGEPGEHVEYRAAG